MSTEDLNERFQEAADSVNKLKVRPTDQELLELYGLFKQANVGDNNQSKPGTFQLKEKAKHEAWLKRKGMGQNEAKEAYIGLATELIKRYSKD